VTFRLSLLATYVVPLGCAHLVSLVTPGWDATRGPTSLRNALVELHAAMALFSYGVFALLALTSLMFPAPPLLAEVETSRRPLFLFSPPSSI